MSSLQQSVSPKQKAYILSMSPLSCPSWKIFALAFWYNSLFGWIWFSLLSLFLKGCILVEYFILVYFWFVSVVPRQYYLLWNPKKTPRLGWCIYFAQEDFIPLERTSWHLPSKSYLLPQKSHFLLQSSVTTNSKSLYLRPLIFDPFQAECLG